MLAVAPASAADVSIRSSKNATSTTSELTDSGKARSLHNAEFSSLRTTRKEKQHASQKHMPSRAADTISNNGPVQAATTAQQQAKSPPKPSAVPSTPQVPQSTVGSGGGSGIVRTSPDKPATNSDVTSSYPLQRQPCQALTSVNNASAVSAAQPSGMSVLVLYIACKTHKPHKLTQHKSQTCTQSQFDAAIYCILLMAFPHVLTLLLLLLLLFYYCYYYFYIFIYYYYYYYYFYFYFYYYLLLMMIMISKEYFQ